MILVEPTFRCVTDSEEFEERWAWEQAREAYEFSWQIYYDLTQLLANASLALAAERRKRSSGPVLNGRAAVFDHPQTAEYIKAWHKFDNARRKLQYAYGAYMDAKMELGKFYPNDTWFSCGN